MRDRAKDGPGQTEAGITALTYGLLVYNVDRMPEWPGLPNPTS